MSINNLFSRVCARIAKRASDRFAILRVACSVKVKLKMLFFFGRFNRVGVASSPAPVRVRVHLCRRGIGGALVGSVSHASRG